MSHKYARTSLFLISLLNFLFLYLDTQAQNTDFQTWTSATIEKSFSKKLDGSIGQELRLKDNSTRLKSTFTDLGARYEAVKNLKIGAYFRFITDGQDVAYRVYSEISYELKLDRSQMQP